MANMTYTEAVAKADALRLNSVSSTQKIEWVFKIDCEIADMMGIKPDDEDYPTNAGASEVLMAAPYDDIYYLYVIAMADYYNEEIALYENDMALFSAALADAKAYYRRNNAPADSGKFKVFV